MREAALATTFGEATGVPPVFANSGGMSLLYPMTVLPDLRSFSEITLQILPIPIRQIASSFAIYFDLLERRECLLGIECITYRWIWYYSTWPRTHLTCTIYYV